jgi:hypothetical protein
MKIKPRYVLKAQDQKNTDAGGAKVDSKVEEKNNYNPKSPPIYSLFFFGCLGPSMNADSTYRKMTCWNILAKGL